jgi:type I restriction enzyme R subunit
LGWRVRTYTDGEGGPPKNLTLRRALVHFAVDNEQVFMTTRLDGERTVFLPFNRGDGLAAGNPPNPAGHRSAYLWESVWQKDAWLDILARFIHVEPAAKGSMAPATMIFPRFHQWDAVWRLEERRLEPRAQVTLTWCAAFGKIG